MFRALFHTLKYSKVKVKKWIDTPNLQKNKKYVLDWHYFIDDVQNKLAKISDDDLIKKIDMFILQHFFVERYTDSEDFYSQFNVRMEKAKKVVDMLTQERNNES